MIIKNSNELHEYLNTNPSEVKTIDNITEIIFNSIKENKQIEPHEIQSLELERATYSFIINKDQLNSRATFPNKEGNLISYPSIHGYTEEHFKLFEGIFNDTQCNVLAGYIGHFLWINGRKHNKYLKKSKVGYLNTINELLEQNGGNIENNEKNKNYHIIYGIIDKLLYISQRTKDTGPVIQTILKLTNSEKHKFLHYSIIQLIIDNRKLFPPDDISSIPDLCITRSEDSESHFTKIDFLNMGRRFDELTQVKSHPWKILLADQYNILAHEREDLAGIEFANKSSRLYEEAGKKDLAKELAQLYEQKSSENQLSTVETEHDVTDAVKFFDQEIEELFTNDLPEIINFLRESTLVLPSKSIVDKIVQDSLSHNRLRFYTSNQIFDSNGHVAQHFTTEEEVIKLITLENYFQLVRMRFDILVSRLLIKLIGRKDWTASNFLDVLSSMSWFGQPIRKSFSQHQKFDVKYIDLIEPGIRSFFYELESWNANRDKYIPNFTLAIDSLTLKIEGLLREICKQNGIQTFYIRQDEKKRNITREKDISMLLRDESLTIFLGEDLTIYLKSIFVERVGNNLRNEVAHSFLLPFEYKNFITISKVFVAILRLSNWTIDETQ